MRVKKTLRARCFSVYLFTPSSSICKGKLASALCSPELCYKNAELVWSSTGTPSPCECPSERDKAGMAVLEHIIIVIEQEFQILWLLMIEPSAFTTTAAPAAAAVFTATTQALNHADNAFSGSSCGKPTFCSRSKRLARGFDSLILRNDRP